MVSKVHLLFRVLLIAAVMQLHTVIVVGEPQVPCYFLFGDSLVDTGNNNRFVKAEKANYPPYGIDFPQGVTGRFTNGRTAPDIIGQLLGFSNFTPLYSTVTNEEIDKGVNYGSAGAGIREETGRNLGERTSFDKQILNHQGIISRLWRLMQDNQTLTNEYIKKCIYIVNIGSDDYVNNYLMPSNYSSSSIFNPDQYATLLIQQYSQQLTTLYNLGARKVAVFGLGPIGCTPAEIAIFGTNGKPCVESINNLIKLFNDRLKPLVDDLNNGLSDARFTYINFSGIAAPLRTLPNFACCQIGSDGLCIPNSNPCPIRTLSSWYDGFHPSETANKILASRAYKKLSPTDASPYDISHLAQL